MLRRRTCSTANHCSQLSAHAPRRSVWNRLPTELRLLWSTNTPRRRLGITFWRLSADTAGQRLVVVWIGDRGSITKLVVSWCSLGLRAGGATLMTRSQLQHRCKKSFNVFFILVTFLRFLTFFIFQRFLFFLNVGKVQSGKQINKKPFQNNSNQIDLWFFLLHVEWFEMPPYKLLLTYYVWRIVWRPWREFLRHPAWSWTTLRRGNVFYYVCKLFEYILLRFYVFNVFYFYLNVFLHLWVTVTIYLRLKAKADRQLNVAHGTENKKSRPTEKKLKPNNNAQM